MAKRSKNQGTRDDLSSLTVTLRSRPARAIQLIEDLRTFHPAPAERPARLFSGVTATVGLADQPQKKKGTRRSRVPVQLAFTAPQQTLVCVRRRRRKEVLFAKNKTGKRGQRRARWSKWSDTKC